MFRDANPSVSERSLWDPRIPRSPVVFRCTISLSVPFNFVVVFFWFTALSTCFIELNLLIFRSLIIGSLLLKCMHFYKKKFYKLNLYSLFQEINAHISFNAHIVTAKIILRHGNYAEYNCIKKLKKKCRGFF